MKERERLIDLIKNSINVTGIDWDRVTEKIADYLLDNDIIVPPCKIGDKLYTVIYDNVPKKWYIAEDNISEIGKKGLFISLDAEFFDYIPYSEIGKDYFLTREEAEAALKAREK